MAEPPATISVLVCPRCGRDDRFQPFYAHWHSTFGQRCDGVPRKATYRLDRRAWLLAGPDTPEAA